MVDKTLIRQLVKKNFSVSDKDILINDQGLVSCRSKVYLTNTTLKKLPVRFDKMDGDFTIWQSQLITLEGCPRYVEGDFMITGSQNLTSLEGGPKIVNGDYYCTEIAFTSMDGAPEHVGQVFSITYTRQLPLLRLLQYKGLDVLVAPAEVRQILNTYAGTSNPGDILTCASELTEAGFDGNAEW